MPSLRRRVGDPLPSDVAMTRTDGALAQQTQPEVPVMAGPVAMEGGRTAAKRPQPVQGSLFWERPAGKVIPFESFPTAPVAAPPRTRTKTSAAAPKSGTKPRRNPRHYEGQGELDFLPAAPPKPRTLGTTVEAVIFCEDPVASRLHRAVAAACDWSMVLLAYGIFLLVYRFCGGEFLLDKTSLLLIGGVLPLLGCLYGLLWAVAGYETPGMRWTNLRLTSFDGFRPEKDQRMLRFLGSCLSLCTLVGLLWSFADEESLAWPDHMSGTFPTPRRVDSQTFHRK